MSDIKLELPSKCLVYKNVDQSQIVARTLKGKDELLLAEMSSDNFDKKFLALLRNILKGIDPEQLTLGDKLYLAIWLTINSYSKDYIYEYECEHCWQKSEYVVDLSKLEIVELPEGFKEPYTIKLPDNGLEINLRLLKFQDLIRLSDMEKSGANVFLRKYAMSIVDEKKSLIERESFLSELSVKDTAMIRGFHEKFYHGPKMEVSYECPKCGGTGVMPVTFRLDMFLPYGKRLKQYLGDAI